MTAENKGIYKSAVTLPRLSGRRGLEPLLSHESTRYRRSVEHKGKPL